MADIRILIVEDEFIIAEDMKLQLNKLSYSVTGIASSFDSALEEIEDEKPDLILIDIQLKGNKDGIELADVIRSEYDLPFIFLTSHADSKTVERAKKVHPNGYLTKPFEREDLYTSIEIAFSNYIEQKAGKKESSQLSEENNAVLSDSIFVKKDHLLLKIKFEELEWIKAERNYLELHCGEKKHLIRSTLQDFLGKLPVQMFFQIHRSYAINLTHITAIEYNQVLLHETAIPLGRSFTEQLKEKLKIFQ